MKVGTVIRSYGYTDVSDSSVAAERSIIVFLDFDVYLDFVSGTLTGLVIPSL